jgi:hypothetical protein
MTLQALVVGATWWTVFLVNATQGHPWRGLALATLALALGLALLPRVVAHDVGAHPAARRQP